MSLRHTVIDFLGNVLGEDGQPTEAKVFDQAQRCYWMEVARAVLESYVIAAIQLSPVRIYRDGGSDESHDHDAYLWNVSPNPNQSRAAFVASLVHEALTQEGALVVPIARGRYVSLYVADSFGIQVQPGREQRYTGISIEGSSEVARNSGYRSGEVYHFELAPCPGWDRLVTLAADEYAKLGSIAEKAFEDSGAMRYKLRTEIPVSGSGAQMDKVAAYIEDSLKPFLKGDRGVLPVYKGFDLERLGAASATASWRKSEDVIAIRKDMFDAVAACFRAPSSLIYGNTNNFADVLSSFLTFGVDPVARGIEDEIARKTLTEAEWAAGGGVIVDTTRINHVDLFAIADRAEKLVGSSIDTPNEIRALTRQRRSDASGMDDYQRTKNFETAGGGEQNA